MENGRHEDADLFEEQQRLCSMRAFVHSRDPSSKDMDDLILRRFLRARDLGVERAGKLLLKYLRWRREFVPNGCISESEMPNEIAQNKAFLQGFDKKGRPIMLFLAARHFPNRSGGRDEFKHKTIASISLSYYFWIPSGQEKFVAVADLQAWGFSNCDIQGYISAISLLQIIFVEKGVLRSTLLEDIEESQLAEIYGGKQPFVPIHKI